MFDFFADLASLAPLLTAGLVIAGFLSLRRITRSSRQSLILGLYGRTMEHNNTIVADKYQRAAIDVFHGLESNNPTLRSNRTSLEAQENGYYELYWATRAVHLSHLFLIYQVWNLADESRSKFEKRYYGWAVFAQKILKELHGQSENFDSKPDWYRDACRDIDPSVNESASYSKTFFEYSAELIQSDRSGIGR